MSSDHVSFSVAREILHEFFEKFVPTKRDEYRREYMINEQNKNKADKRITAKLKRVKKNLS